MLTTLNILVVMAALVAAILFSHLLGAVAVSVAMFGVAALGVWHLPECVRADMRR